MKTIDILTLAEEEQRSRTGKFHSWCKNISVAFGARRRVNEAGEAHPFDLQQRRIPPGAAVCPYHSHATQWELFVIVSGEATVRRDGQTYAINAGTAFIHPPGVAHQIVNRSTTEDLVVFIVADNPLVDVFHYPDSNKFGLRPLGKYFRMVEVDYFDGEDSPTDQPGIQTAPPSRPASSSFPAAEFKWVNIGSLPWRESKSRSGRFQSSTKDISIALGAKANAIPADGGHPFDLQLRRVPPGAAVCPQHAHTLQWEMFVIIAGTATVRVSDETFVVGGGHVFLHRPGVAHQTINSGTEDLLFYVIADNHAADSTYYPNSNKWQMKPQAKLFRMAETDYFDGED